RKIATWPGPARSGSPTRASKLSKSSFYRRAVGNERPSPFGAFDPVNLPYAANALHIDLLDLIAILVDVFDRNLSFEGRAHSRCPDRNALQLPMRFQEVVARSGGAHFLKVFAQACLHLSGVTVQVAGRIPGARSIHHAPDHSLRRCSNGAVWSRRAQFVRLATGGRLGPTGNRPPCVTRHPP